MQAVRCLVLRPWSRSRAAVILIVAFTLALSGTAYAYPGRSPYRVATVYSGGQAALKTPFPAPPCLAPSYAKAYGYVSGDALPKALPAEVCVSRHTPKVAHRVPAYYNAVERSPIAGSAPGTYCFLAAHGLIPGTKEGVVLVSVVGGVAPGSPSALQGITAELFAAWIPEASNCRPGEFEIQTWEVTGGSTGLTKTPSGYINFSFVIP
jgi:hypothetical protein